MDSYDSDISQIQNDGSVLASQRYTDIKPLHESSAGMFLLLRSSHLGKWVVLKALKPEYRNDPFCEAILHKEFRIGYGLRHRGVVETVDFVNLPQVGNAIVLEYIDGVNLRQYLEDNRSLTTEKAMHLISEICEAVSYLHSHKIIHRDLKPENIMIEHATHAVKVIDLGCADATDYCIVKGPAGTRHYAAPEQLEQGAVVDVRTDIYAIGKILIDIKVSMGKARNVHRVAMKCIEPRPADRYQSIPELRDALDKTTSRRVFPWYLSILILAAIAVALLLPFVGKTDAGLTEAQSDTLVRENERTETVPKHDTGESVKYEKPVIEYIAPQSSNVSDAKEEAVSGNVAKKIPEHAVDMGLSVMWSDCNVGALSASDYGDYFAWGEIGVKENYLRRTYQYSDSIRNDVCLFIGDNISGTEYDVAHELWSDGWALPTMSHWRELVKNCIWQWTKLNQHNGYMVTSKINGNSIFFPASGCKVETTVIEQGAFGYYWSASLNDETHLKGAQAFGLYFNNGTVSVSYWYRHRGCPVRPVMPYNDQREK